MAEGRKDHTFTAGRRPCSGRSPPWQVGWWRLLPSVWRDALLLNSLPQSSSSGSAPRPDSSPLRRLSGSSSPPLHLHLLTSCSLSFACGREHPSVSPRAAGTGITSVAGFLSSLAACSTKNVLKYCTPAQGHFTWISFLLLSVHFIRRYKTDVLMSLHL